VCCRVVQCVAVCCRVVQCVAVCCRVVQCVAVCCRVVQCVAVSLKCALQCGAVCVAVCCSVLQCVAVRCSAFQCVALHCSVSWHSRIIIAQGTFTTATQYNKFHGIATHGNTLQHAATHCNTVCCHRARTHERNNRPSTSTHTHGWHTLQHTAVETHCSCNSLQSQLTATLWNTPQHTCIPNRHLAIMVLTVNVHEPTSVTTDCFVMPNAMKSPPLPTAKITSPTILQVYEQQKSRNCAQKNIRNAQRHAWHLFRCLNPKKIRKTQKKNQKNVCTILGYVCVCLNKYMWCTLQTYICERCLAM